MVYEVRCTAAPYEYLKHSLYCSALYNHVSNDKSPSFLPKQLFRAAEYLSRRGIAGSMAGVPFYKKPGQSNSAWTTTLGKCHVRFRLLIALHVIHYVEHNYQRLVRNEDAVEGNDATVVPVRVSKGWIEENELELAARRFFSIGVTKRRNSTDKQSTTLDLAGYGGSLLFKKNSRSLVNSSRRMYSCLFRPLDTRWQLGSIIRLSYKVQCTR